MGGGGRDVGERYRLLLGRREVCCPVCGRFGIVQVQLEIFVRYRWMMAEY